MTTINRPLRGLLAVLLLFCSAPLFAMPPTGRHMQGTVTSVNVISKEMILRREDNGKVIGFTWNRRTLFAKGGAVCEPSFFKRGDIVKVIRHTPFFGKPFATRVVVTAP